MQKNADFVICGGGLIGLATALELDRRGASVIVLEAGEAMRQTSSAAAGMLAVDDPANPPALHPLAAYSARLYPAFLDRLEETGGQHVSFQTRSTLEQTDANGLADARELLPLLAADAPSFQWLDEQSVDPKQLAAAVLAVTGQTRIDLRERAPMLKVAMHAAGVRIETGQGSFTAGALVDCLGAWSPAPVKPRKGQMLAVKMPPGFDLNMVVRTRDVYVVPRTEGPHAGRVIIGATIEDAGYDLTVHALDILTLNARAVKLLPGLANAEFLESWAGLRPATADGLPILGATDSQPRYVLANGMFRNGILLAPAVAAVTAQRLLGEEPAVDLADFAPSRFLSQSRTA